MTLLASVPAVPALTPSPSAAPATQDLWWAGYHAGITTGIWICVLIVAFALVAYAAGRKSWPFGSKVPSWWEHHDKPNLPQERLPKLSGQ